MSVGDRVRAMSNGPVRMDRASAEAALARAVDKLGLKPRPIRWVRSYADLKKVDGWAPAQNAFQTLPMVSPRIIDQRIYDFLNSRDWAAVSGAFAEVSVMSAVSNTLLGGLRSVWTSG